MAARRFPAPWMLDEALIDDGERTGDEVHIVRFFLVFRQKDKKTLLSFWVPAFNDFFITFKLITVLRRFHLDLDTYRPKRTIYRANNKQEVNIFPLAGYFNSFNIERVDLNG